MNIEEQRLERLRKIEDLTQQVIRAQIFYDLWWRLTGEPMEHHIDGMNLHPDFFRFARHSFLMAMIVQLMMPFDRGRNSLSLKTLLRSAGDGQGALAIARAQIEQVLNAAGAMIEKVKLLRDECFAHRSAASSYNDVFRQAGIRPKDLKELIETALGAVNRLRQAEGMDLADYQPQPANSLDELLAHLQSIASEE